jgi:hypothetical protein
MPGLVDTFGVSLKAYTDVDKASLDRGAKTVGDAFGKAYSGSGKSALGAQAAIKAGTQETTRFGGAISRVRDALNATWHTTGLGRTVDQLRDAKQSLSEFHDQAEKTGKLFGLGREVFALAGIGGIGMALERFAAHSVELRNTAGTFGVSTSMLQRFRGAAGLSGLDPGAATSAIGALQQNLFGARVGTNATALGAAKMLGLDVNQDPTVFLKKLADKIKGQAPQIQREIAEAFGVQDLLPVLRKGGEAIDELTAAAKRHSELTAEQIDQGEKLDRAYNDVTQSTIGFADALAARLSPSLTPILTGFSTWLDDLKQSPKALDDVGKGVEILAAAVGVTLVSAFAKLTWAMTSWWALPAVKFLTSGIGAALTLPLLTGGDTPNDPTYQDWTKKHSADGPGFFGQGGGLEKWIRGLFGGNKQASAGSPTPGDPRGMIPIIRAAAAKYGIDPDVAVRVFGAEGLGTYVGDNGTSFGAPQLHIGGGLGDQFRRDNPGIDITDPKNEAALIDWSLKNVSKTGWGPYHGAARVGVADRQGIGQPSAVTDFFHGLGEFPDKAGAHQILTQTPIAGPLGDKFGSYEPASASDSYHRVEIIAPPGFQGVTRMARGAAELTLRNQTAFSSP